MSHHTPTFAYQQDHHRARLLRSELAMLRARYDHGAVPLSTYTVIKQIEIEISWLEHRQVRL
jgi:hypothetical protein